MENTKRDSHSPILPPRGDEEAPVRGKGEDFLLSLTEKALAPLGYEVVALDILKGREKKLRIFIDRSAANAGQGAIGIEDCVAATRALDEPLDAASEVEALFKGAYELEVSSPGLDRPLRKPADYDRFAGRRARIHTYRPLTAEELENADYQLRNPKQKNFIGVLSGTKGDKIGLRMEQEQPKKPGKRNRKGASPMTTEDEEAPQIFIPLAWVTQANLVPDLDQAFENTKGKGNGTL